MDTRNCTGSFASDGAFKDITTRCDTDMNVYWSLSGVVIIWIGLHLLINFWIFIKKGKRTIPTSLWLVLSVYFFYVFNILLIGFNIVKYTDGSALALFSISFTPLAMLSAMSYIKIVRLGAKIIPMTLKNLESREALKKLNRLQVAFIVFQLSSIFGSTLLFVAIGPIIPQHEHVFGQVGFALKAFYFLFNLIGYIHQFERCVQVVKSIARDVEHIQQSSQDYSKAINQMRFQQLIVTINGGPALLIWFFLAFDLLIWNVYVVYFLFVFLGLLNNIMFLILEVIKMRRLEKKKLVSAQNALLARQLPPSTKSAQAKS
jgi:hypothetical protein